MLPNGICRIREFLLRVVVSRCKMTEFSQQDEKQRLEEVVQQLSEPLLHYLRRYTGDPVLAEDLCQETLIRVAQGLPHFQGKAGLQTWAFSIATRVVAGHFRQPANRLHVVEFDESMDLPDSQLPIDERLVIDEMNTCIRSLIDTLPEDYRAALILHDLQNLTAQEVAEICDCSQATAKIRIHRARGRLKQAMQQACCFYRDGDNVLRCDRKSA